MSNIKLSGRLSLAYDVLVHGVKALPENILNDSLKIFLQPDYKTQFLYKLKGKDTLSRIQSLIEHCSEVLQLVQKQPELNEDNAIQLVERFKNADKLNVRGAIKCNLVIGTKLIAHNFRQLTRFFQGDLRKKVKESLKSNQGTPIAI